MTPDEVMKRWFEQLSPEEQKVARRSIRRYRREINECKQGTGTVTIAHGNSTPGYYAIIEHRLARN